MSINDPNTHLRFKYLPNDDRRWIVSDYGGLRINSLFQCEVKVELTLQHPIPVDRFGNYRTGIISIWVPINEFRFFGEGNIFKGQRQHGRAKLGVFRDFDALPNYSIADINFISVTDGLRINKILNLKRSNRVSKFIGAPYIVSSDNEGNRIFINPIETLRFFFSSFSGISSYLYEVSKSKEKSDTLIDRNKTGYISDGVYRIVPNSKVSDIASAFQLALIDTSPHLQDIWTSFISTLNILDVDSPQLAPEIHFPDDSVGIGTMSFMTRSTIGKSLPDKCWVIRQLLSDKRQIPFKKLIIEQPNIRYQTAGEQIISGAGKARKVTEVNKIVLSKSAGSSKSKKFGYTGLPSLIEAFPNIENVQIKVERPDTAEVRTTVPIELKKIVAEEFTTSSGDSFMKTPGIIFRPPLHRRELFGGVEFEKGVPKRLFERPIQQFANIVTKPEAIPQRFKVLAEASGIISQKQNSSLDKLIVLELPSSWGSWAKGFTKGRGRYVGVIQYFKDDRLNYAFEIENNKKAYAIGIINKVMNDNFDLHDLTCVMDHCTTRINLRGQKRLPEDAYCGIWPNSIEYTDVAGTTLNHSSKRDHPHFLANDLLSKGISGV